MEITVRPGQTASDHEATRYFAAAVTFLQPGPLALERIQLSVRADTYHGVMLNLIEGFKVTPGTHDKDSVEFRVLTALCHATGVVDIEA